MGGRENWRRMGGWEVGEDGEHGEDGCEDGMMGGWVGGWYACVHVCMCAMMLAALFVGRADACVDGCGIGHVYRCWLSWCLYWGWIQ